MASQSCGQKPEKDDVAGSRTDLQVDGNTGTEQHQYAQSSFAQGGSSLPEEGTTEITVGTKRSVHEEDDVVIVPAHETTRLSTESVSSVGKEITSLPGGATCSLVGETTVLAGGSGLEGDDTTSQAGGATSNVDSHCTTSQASGPTDSLSIDNHQSKMRIARALEKFPTVCTYELVHQARAQRYGTAYTDLQAVRDWYGKKPRQVPGQNDQGPSEWKKVGSQDVLDLAMLCHIPNNTPQTIEFEQHAREIVQTLMEEAAPKIMRSAASLMKENYGKQVNELENVTFNLQPIGSFLSDAKVAEIDEFDYLFVMDLRNIDKSLKSDISRILRDEFHDIVRSLIGVHETSTENLASNGKAYLSEKFEHGPALCMELSWRCQHSHVHTTGLDMSPVAIWEDTTYSDLLRNPDMWTKITVEDNEEFEDTLSDRLRPPFDKLLTLTHPALDFPLLYMLAPISTQPPVSTCPLDMPLYYCAESVAANFKPLFCALKILTSLILPTLVSASWLTGTPGPKPLSLVDSHVLKMILLQEVMAHPLSEDWEGEHLVERFKGCLIPLTANMKLGTSWPTIRDMVSGKILSRDICNHYIPGYVKDYLRYVSCGWESFSVPPGTTPGLPAGCVYVRAELASEPSIHITTPERMAPCHHRNIFLIHSSHKPLPHSEHPLCKWIQYYLHDVYTTEGGADLRQVPEQDYRAVVGLYDCGILSASHLHDGYQGKLLTLRTTCKRLRLRPSEVITMCNYFGSDRLLKPSPHSTLREQLASVSPTQLDLLLTHVIVGRTLNDFESIIFTCSVVECCRGLDDKLRALLLEWLEGVRPGEQRAAVAYLVVFHLLQGWEEATCSTPWRYEHHQNPDSDVDEAMLLQPDDCPSDHDSSESD